MSADIFSRLRRYIEGELTPGQRLGALALAALIFAAAVVLYQRSVPTVPVRLDVAGREGVARDEGAELRAPAAREVVVHVAGAVKSPGIYRLKEGQRIDDAVRAAGGTLPAGLVHELNLAAQLADGQKIVVPAAAPAGQRGAAAGARAGAGAPGGAGGHTHSSGGSADSSDVLTGQVAPGEAPGIELVDLNSATPEQLETLPGVGPAIAGRILEYRKSHGGFRAVVELQQVKGIGPKKFKDIKGKVAAGP